VTPADVRSVVVYAGFRLGMGIVGALPRRTAVRLGEGLASAAAPFFGSRRRMALRHARRLGVADPERHVRRVFAAYGRYWAETLWVRPRRRTEIEAFISLEGGEHLEAAIAGKRGMVLALPHLGNWEFAGPIGDRLGFELVAVAENLANQRVRDWFVEMRRQMGIGIVLATGGATVMRSLQAVLARNGAVALLCDRDLKGRGVAVEFFGERTTLPAGPVSLALKMGAPLLPAAAYFGPDGTHRVVIRPPISLRAEDSRSEAVAEGTQRLARELESLIQRAPEQWHLLQPNWPSDRASTDVPGATG
jgi:phosphatidylinositol dimannoside acyltransferase